jgi:hypothetical protein
VLVVEAALPTHPHRCALEPVHRADPRERIPAVAGMPVDEGLEATLRAEIARRFDEEDLGRIDQAGDPVVGEAFRRVRETTHDDVHNKGTELAVENLHKLLDASEEEAKRRGTHRRFAESVGDSDSIRKIADIADAPQMPRRRLHARARRVIG